MKGDSSGKDDEKPCATDTSVKKDHNVAAGRRDKSQLYKDATHLMQNERGFQQYATLIALQVPEF